MEQTKATLNAIRECLAKNMPPHGKAMLFGSQARGTARADSDWDIFCLHVQIYPLLHCALLFFP